MTATVKAGELVRCLNCHRPVWRMTKTLRTGDLITADSVEALAGMPQPTAGYEFKCPTCGSNKVVFGDAEIGYWTP